MLYFLGSEPIESKEAEQQWFVVGTADGEKKALFTTWEDVTEYLNDKNGKDTLCKECDGLTVTECMNCGIKY